MNDEIKKILDYLKIENGHCSSELSYDETHLLLDYITNLQEENKKLKELCDKYEEEHNTTFKLWKMKMEEMPTYEEKMIYKSRCEKAIERLTLNGDIQEKDVIEVFANAIRDTRNILNGGK